MIIRVGFAAVELMRRVTWILGHRLENKVKTRYLRIPDHADQRSSRMPIPTVIVFLYHQRPDLGPRS